ncbi:MAG: ABC transporter permease [Bacillota bacterium]
MKPSAMKQFALTLRLALRELRRGRRKFVFFLLGIAIGVAGLVGIRGFNVSLQEALLREARTLMAADMQVSMSRPATAEEKQALARFGERGIQVIHNIETASMAVNPANKETTLVQVKAVAPGYPFYGALEVDPPVALTDETALVGAELLDRLGLAVGDSLKIGAATFRIGGVIVKEPDRVVAGMGIGPRVMITSGGIARAELIQFGSRATHLYLFKLANDQQVEEVRAELRQIFDNKRARIADFREAQPQVKRVLDRMTSFLSLVSMVALLVGGLGVANAVRVFIQQKLDSIAIMKVVGATNRRVIGIFVTQIAVLAILGSAIGVALGYLIQLIMPRVVGQLLALEIDLTLSPYVALQGILVGLATAILFTMLPLTAIADVKPALVFRREMAEQRPRPTLRTRLREGVLLVIAGLGLGLIAAWMANNLTWGFGFMGGLVGAVLILWGASALAVRITRRIRPPRAWLAVRQGLANLHRPGSQAAAVVLALGVGVSLVLGIYLMQQSLMAEIRLTSPAGTPNMFFLGLKQGEEKEFQQLLAAQPGVEKAPEPIPIVRGRLAAIDGKTKDQLDLSDEGQRWFNWEFNLSFAADLPENSELIAGTWWTRDDWGKPLVSVEEEAAQRLNLAIGSQVQMSLEGGKPVTATVASVRRTTDVRAGASFNFVFAPESLQGVPVNYVAQARVKPEQAGPVQKAVVSAFPTVTIINLNDVLETVADVMDRIGLVIRFVAGFSVAAGLIILASSIAATKFRRTREAVLFKTLGATRSKVWRIFAVEYAALGLVAGIVGSLLAAVAAWYVMNYLMDVRYMPGPLPVLAGVVATVVLTVTVGVLSTLDVLAAKPLQVLREE